jgi:hypothetical protein
MAVLESDLVVGPLTPAAGVTTISLDFYFEQASWLEVYKSGSETPLVLNTDYTVTGAGTGSGVVTLAVAANGTDAYSVYLIVPLQRSSDMQLRGGFKSGPFNTELDRLWQAIQGINTRVAQSLRISRTSLVVGPLATGSAAARAGRALVFGASGSDLGIGPTAAEIASAQSFAASAGTSATEAADSAASAGTSATEAADSAASAAASATGDVEGPASATNNHVALFNGATGKLIKSGGFAFTAAGQAIAAATDAAAQRTTLGAASVASVALKAPIESPQLTGTPSAPTAAAATNTTQLATTAYTRTAIPNMLNATGSAPMYACRAWVNFNGTGTVAIRASGNVSSITDNGTGDYTVNFGTDMEDANYAATANWNSGSLNLYDQNGPAIPVTYGVGSVRILLSDGLAEARDGTKVSVAIFR